MTGAERSRVVEKLIKVMRENSFEISKADPCLLIKNSDDVLIIISIYVDDCILIGSSTTITKTKQHLRENFSIKEFKTVENYLGCKIQEREGQIKIGQVKMYKEMKKMFVN